MGVGGGGGAGGGASCPGQDIFTPIGASCPGWGTRYPGVSSSPGSELHRGSFTPRARRASCPGCKINRYPAHLFLHKYVWANTEEQQEWSRTGSTAVWPRPVLFVLQSALCSYFIWQLHWLCWCSTKCQPITKTCLFNYTENFTTKNENFQIKNSDIFSYFCSKHRLWVLVRTALMRRV